MALDIVRAWKDPEYRKTLTTEQLASLPPNPAGSATLSDEELSKVVGGIDGFGLKPTDTNACQCTTIVKGC